MIPAQDDEDTARFAALSETEKKALIFIEKESLYYRSPSVRVLANHVGLKSSRSGVRIIRKLVADGFVVKNKRGELKCSERGYGVMCIYKKQRRGFSSAPMSCQCCI